MSRKSKAPNTKKAAREYVLWLASLEVAESILLAGSRSPLREKKHHKDSDWDLILVSKIKGLKLPSPRWDNRLHADLLVLTPEQAKHKDKAAEVWPTDKHKVFKGVRRGKRS